MDSEVSDTGIYLYLSAVVGLSAFIILTLYGFFLSGFVEGTETFLADPVGTLQTNPIGFVVLFVILAAIVLLFAVVVGFGARCVAASERRELRK